MEFNFDEEEYIKDYSDLFKDQITKKFGNTKDGFLKFVGSVVCVESAVEYHNFIDIFESKNPLEYETRACGYTICDLAKPFRSWIDNQYTPELLAQLTFNDPEFVKALPDWVFEAQDCKCYPLKQSTSPFNRLQPDFNAKPITFKEAYLSRLEIKFEEEASKVAKNIDAFGKLCYETKKTLPVINERFLEIEKMKDQNVEKSKGEIADMFKQMREGTFKSTEKSIG